MNCVYEADVFKCRIGGGCTQKVCDGVANCGDRSDEWNRLSIQKRTSALEAHVGNQTALICSDNWNSGHSNMACHLMGYTDSTNYEEVDKPTDISKFIILKNDIVPGTSLLLQLESVDSCDKVVSLTCQKFECGSFKNVTETLKEDSKNQTAEWPSLALLYSNKQNIYCTATLVAPSWVVAGYSCLLGTLNRKNISPKDWILRIGDQQRTIGSIIEYPQVIKFRITER
ncbi:transmembrane protease serine 3-like [Harmonia axyridis]|uniref:transmembrane protease serine 3-like n=1 Tax=Harmonia axyridis TaxID=115357 RepID=UPI001E279182|nr:transmembrane protease serine 3-like [Harmonia axyridis]